MKRTQHVGKSVGKSKTKMRMYTTREAIRIVQRNGWKLVRTKGDHYYFKHPDHPKLLTISKKLNRMIWERCVPEFNIDLNA